MKDQIELPPLPKYTLLRGLHTSENMQKYARAAIKPYQKRIEELEAQLEAVGAGGVSSQRITSQRRGELVAFAKDGNLFWRGDPVAWREFSGELYLAPQPVNPVELDRYDAGLLGGQDGMPAYVWHDIIRAELDRAYDFYMDQLDRATPQPATPAQGPSVPDSCRDSMVAWLRRRQEYPIVSLPGAMAAEIADMLAAAPKFGEEE